MSDIAVLLPDGSSRQVPADSDAASLAASISRGLAKVAIAAEINGRLVDLSCRLSSGDRVRIVTADSEE